LEPASGSTHQDSLFFVSGNDDWIQQQLWRLLHFDFWLVVPETVKQDLVLEST
jgi:hypothetical protein